MTGSAPDLAPPAASRPRVLVVDDERGPRESLRIILEPDYDVRVARNATEAFALLAGEPIDVVMLDLNMPGLPGEQLMRTLRRDCPDVEVVIVTGHGSLENATEAIRCGVADYLQKPFDVVQVSAAVLRAVSRRRSRSQREGLLAALPQDNTKPMDEDWTRSLHFLEVLAGTVEEQSGFLRGHARRTGFYAGLLADRLKLEAGLVQRVRIAGFIHDVGKIGVPTELLMRPSALTPQERRQLERHPEIGARLVEPLDMPSEIGAAVRHHHEWWDGRGYGDGLFGEQIPLSARIVAIADAYDAMTCDRPYRRALPEALVRQELDRCAGAQFDPKLAKEFLRLMDTSEMPLLALAEATACLEDEAA